MEKNLECIPISELPITDKIDNVWIIVHKKEEENNIYKSYKALVNLTGCTCEPKPDIEPDEYEELPKNAQTVFHVMDVAGYENERNRDVSPYDMDDWDPSRNDHDVQTNGMWAYNHPNSSGQYIRPGAYSTQKVIDCDEITFFAQPLRYNTGYGVTSGSLRSLDIRQVDIDGARMFKSRITDLNNFNSLYGSYFPWGREGLWGAFFPVGSELLNNKGGFRIYTDNTKNKEITFTGWTIPNTPMILQLIGQLPRHHELNGTGTRWDDIKDFFFCDSATDTIGVVDANWGHHKNISGISLLPGGKSPNIDYYQEPPEVDSFGTTAVMPTWKTNGGIALTSFAVTGSPMHQVGLRISSSIANAHGGNIRYARPKTIEELGYRLIVDRLTDEVKFEDPSFDVDAANAATPPVTFPAPEPIEIFKKKQESGTYNWNHANTLGYTNQSLLKGNKIVEVQVEMAAAGIWHLVVTSNNQNAPLFVKRYYPFEVQAGWNTISCDIDLATNEWLMLGALYLNLPDDSGSLIDTARQKVVYPSGVSPFGGPVFTCNNGQTVSDMDPNVSITIQPPAPAPVPRYYELPIGIERGIALRYANRKHKVVLRSWTEIEKEAEELRTKLIIGID